LKRLLAADVGMHETVNDAAQPKLAMVKAPLRAGADTRRSAQGLTREAQKIA
jgi:hypothetical protein